MITDRIGLHSVLLPLLIIRITFSKDYCQENDTQEDYPESPGNNQNSVNGIPCNPNPPSSLPPVILTFIRTFPEDGGRLIIIYPFFTMSESIESEKLSIIHTTCCPGYLHAENGKKKFSLVCYFKTPNGKSTGLRHEFSLKPLHVRNFNWSIISQWTRLLKSNYPYTLNMKLKLFILVKLGDLCI